MKTIAIVNQKGGVGKTTTAINLASYLAMLGKKTLLIDFDAQGNTTRGIGVSIKKGTIYNCITTENDINEYIHKTDIENLDVVPSNIVLANAEIELSTAMGRESILKEKCALLHGYDYCIIDCSPALGLFTVNALTAATDVIVPISTGIFALEGVEQLIKTINLVRRKLNPDIKILGVLLTKFDKRTNLSKEFKDALQETFEKKLFNTIIHQNIKINEAQSAQKPIGIYSETSRGAKEYKQFAKEVIERG